MNEIVSTSADAAVRYLLVGSIAGAILVPLAWLALRATRLRAPVYRHTVWLYCLIGTVALPVVWLHGPKLALPILPARAHVREAPPVPQGLAQSTRAGEPPALSQPGPGTTAAPMVQERSVVPVESTSPLHPVPRMATISWKAVVAGAWLLGFAIILIRLAIGWSRLRSICRTAIPIEPGELGGDFAGRRLEVRVTNELQGPVCLGILRPIVLLPQGMYQDTSLKDLRMVLTHELAHIDRGDCWVNLFQRLLEAMFFFHSLIWLASRQLTHERERICDNWVLARGVSIDEYMQLLSGLGERILMKTRHVPTVALFEGGLLSRVRSLLDPQHSRITRMTRRTAWTCAMSFFLCFAALGTIRLSARPDPGVSSTPAAAVTLTGASAADSNDTSFRPQEEHLGPSQRRPNGNCSLSGRVISEESNEPVDDATVYLFSHATFDAIFIRVASDGSFLFQDIAAGTYSLRTTGAAGYQVLTYNPDGPMCPNPSFTLGDGEQRTGIVLKLKPACTISGVILDESGRPLSNEKLWVVAWQEKDTPDGLGCTYEIAAQATVTADGSYVLDRLDTRPFYVMAMDYRSEQKDDYWPPCYYPGTFDRNKAQKVFLDKGKSADNVDIRLQRHGEFALEGTVTDRATGSPIEKALVVVHRTDMLFDHITAYTDAQGHYQIDSLAPGEFLVHVDAKPSGFVKHREPLTITNETNESRLDFSLKPGVTIRGKFVDTAGKEMEFDDPAYGLAYHIGYPNPETQSWSGSANRDTPGQRRHQATFNPGAGDYEEEYMDFPTASTFIVQGMLPGPTVLLFHPQASDLTVQSILYKGHDVTTAGIDTQAEREIQDVTIVIARLTPPAPR
jgi:beta-lactamase regulating signal transducer with metallopeptidase domain/protocatechuate 3,4-dioxygenase beta subunit